jgi:hypothetical protein
MPMIGGEAAEHAALARRPVQGGAPGEVAARDPYDLGWVMDWLYGDAVRPPMPLPPEPEPLPLPRRRPVMPAHEHTPASAEPRATGRRRRARQLALL